MIQFMLNFVEQLSELRNNTKFQDMFFLNSWYICCDYLNNSVDQDQAAPQGAVWSGSAKIAIQQAHLGSQKGCIQIFG